jgi:Na+-transporting NADH:ubiquinone oxidoreductase subunit NqrE
VILSGESILDNSVITAPLAEQVRRYFSFFTIQSNFLVAVAMFLLVTGRTESALYRVVRLASLVGITVTGVVAAVALPPDPRYTLLNLLCDRLLHIVVPVLTLVGWLFFGPRGYVLRSDVLPALAWPVAWLVATLGLAPITHWYPYPFLNVDRLGWGPVILACVVVSVLFLALAGLVLWSDHRLPGESRTKALDAAT